MIWNGISQLVLAEHRLRIVSTSACVAKAESTRNGATFANADEHADNNQIT
jgi:hypothetical protein